MDETRPAEPVDPAPVPAAPKKSRRQRWIFGGSITAGVIVLLVIVSFVTAHFVDRNSFCGSCHEMKPYSASWRDSQHDNIPCRDCHIPTSTSAFLVHNLGSLRDLGVRIFGISKDPLTVTKGISNATCLRCHSSRPSDPHLPHVIFSHSTHANEACVTCHQQVVHREAGPPYYEDPGAKASCLKCHDGTVAPSTCTTCHTAPHEDRGQCENCHNTLIWGGPAFQHPFPLTGGHAYLRCVDCHNAKQGTMGIPGTDLGNANPRCISCHGDHHNDASKQDCSACHTAESWLTAK